MENNNPYMLTNEELVEFLVNGPDPLMAAIIKRKHNSVAGAHKALSHTASSFINRVINEEIELS